MKLSRPRKCKVCREPYIPRSSFAKVCGAICAIEFVRLENMKVVRKERAEGLAKLKKKSDHLRETQTVFNALRRFECLLLGMPCISCQKHHTGQYHAGHFLAVGSHPNHRFNPNNVWLQCQPCNVHLHGNLVLYQRNLIVLIGAEAVEDMINDDVAKHYTIPQLIEMKAGYSAQLAIVKQRLGAA